MHETQFRTMCHYCKESSLSPLTPNYRPNSTGDCQNIPELLKIDNCQIYSNDATPVCYKCIVSHQYQDNTCKAINSNLTC